MCICVPVSVRWWNIYATIVLPSGNQKYNKKEKSLKKNPVMVLKRNHHILNFVIYISFLLIMLCKSSFLQSCLDYCLDWRSIILIEVFSVMASYGKRISIHILEALCRSLLWRVLRVHLITHTYNTLSNTLWLLHNITEIFANKRLMPVDTDTLPPPKGKTTLSHIFYNLSFWSPLPVSS